MHDDEIQRVRSKTNEKLSYSFKHVHLSNQDQMRQAAVALVSKDEPVNQFFKTMCNIIKKRYLRAKQQKE